MPRNVVVMVAAIAIWAGLSVSALGPSAGATPHAGPLWLRVASYNIHHGADAADDLDLERTALAIESMRADVIGLQEVDRHWGERSDFVDQAAWLGQRLGMHAVFGANVDLDPLEPGRPRRQYGTAILSRYPIVSWRNTHLPRFADHEQRGLLEAVLDVHGSTVVVAGTHLQHDNAAERQAQATKIVELLGANQRRTVLVGDLNAEPGTPEIEILATCYLDSWPVAGVGDGFTYPAELPEKRIDYLLSSPDLHPIRASVITTDASDHLPVVADYFAARR